MPNETVNEAFLEQLLDRWEDAQATGQQLSPEELCATQPEYLPELRRRMEALTAFAAISPPASLSAPVDTPLPVVPGYELLRELGRGGMGVVYLGRQVGLDRTVAVKMLLTGPAAGADQRARFLREGHAIARLQHPHIVQVFDVGEVAGQPYLVMEYLPNGSLGEALRGRPRPPREVAALVRTLADAVQHAHDHGVVHRDLKPGNILLGRSDSGLSPRVADFGLARQLDAAPTTASDNVVGTLAYLAPEQIHSPRQAGPACDIYGLGAILYECLTGRPPYLGEHLLGVLNGVLHQEPLAPRRLNPEVPTDLETICLKCLEKSPARRYPSAADLADDLGRYLEGVPVRARPVGYFETTRRWCLRNPVVSSLLGLVMMAILAVFGVILWSAIQAARDARELAGALRLARRQLAETEQARGLGLLEAGETDLGLLWLGRALEHVPPDETALEADLRRAIGQALQCQRPLERLLDHPGNVRLLAPDPEGRILLTTSGSRVSFWDAPTGERRGDPLDLDFEPLAVSWHPSSRQVTLGGARVVHLDAMTGRPTGIAPALGPSPGVVALAWDATGASLGVATLHPGKPNEGEISVWSGTDGGVILPPKPVAGAVVALAHHPTRGMLAALLDRAVGDRIGGRVVFLDPQTGKEPIPSFDVPGKPGLLRSGSLTFAPNGDSLWTVAGGRLSRWSLNGQCLDVLPSPREKSPDVAFHPDGAEVYLAEGAVARGYSIRTGAALSGPIRREEGLTQVCWTSKGARLLTAGADHTVAVWGPLSHPGRSYPDRVSTTVFSPDGQRAFTAAEDGSADLWLREGSTWRAAPLRHPGRVDPAGFSPDGNVLLTVSDGRKVIRRFAARDGRLLGEPIPLDATVDQLAIAPVGDHFAVTSGGRVHVRRIATGEVIGMPAPLAGHPVLLAYLGGGERLLVLTHEAAIGTQAQEFTVEGMAAVAPARAVPDAQGHPFDRLAASADGRLLAYWADGGHFQVYDRIGDRIPYRGSAGGSKTTPARFHPQEPLVVVGTESGQVQVVDLLSERVRSRAVHGVGLARVWLIPDGSVAITSGADGSLRQWDTTSGRPLGTAWHHADAIGMTVACSADGRWILAGCLDGSVRLWDRNADVTGTPAEVRRVLEQRTGLMLLDTGRIRALSSAEWRNRTLR